MREQGGKLVATDEPTIVAEPSFEAIIVEDSQGDGCLSGSPGTDERLVRGGLGDQRSPQPSRHVQRRPSVVEMVTPRAYWM